MNTPLLFYVVDEHTDIIKYCKKKGMAPNKTEDKICHCSDPSIGNQIIKSVIQYAYKGYLYDVLDVSQCYSGYEVTLMRLPKLSYEELLETALTSKHFEERAGSIGMILKDYPAAFERFLLSVQIKKHNALEGKEGINRLADFIIDFIWQNNSYVWPLKKILLLCEKIRGGEREI